MEDICHIAKPRLENSLQCSECGTHYKLRKLTSDEHRMLRSEWMEIMKAWEKKLLLSRYVRYGLCKPCAIYRERSLRHKSVEELRQCLVDLKDKYKG